MHALLLFFVCVGARARASVCLYVCLWVGVGYDVLFSGTFELCCCLCLTYAQCRFKEENGVKNC